MTARSQGSHFYLAGFAEYLNNILQVYNYWEPAHQLLYGQGLQTWEYDPRFALRSYLYILLHLVPGWLYATFAQPNPMLVFYFLRFLFGLLCAFCEVS